MPPTESSTIRFFDACTSGDVEVLRELLREEPALAHAADPRAPHAGWTGLHAAARAARPDVVRLLLQHGADPSAREAGDNTTPLFWAAAAAQTDAVRAMLDAGADATAAGDAHELDVIGWGAFYHGPDETGISQARRQTLSLLVDRGARHHIFSAMCVGDLALIRRVVEQDSRTLGRRTSRFDGSRTPVEFALDRHRYDILNLLIELGADPNAPGATGQTPLEQAMLKGDADAMRALHAAGAVLPSVSQSGDAAATIAGLAGSVRKVIPMLTVPDVARALAWYTSIGFREVERYGDAGVVNFGLVSLGGAELMLNMHGSSGRHDVSLWLYTDQIDAVYEALKSRQLTHATAILEGRVTDTAGVEFEQPLTEMFYGARQFCIRDLNGYSLYFIQPLG